MVFDFQGCSKHLAQTNPKSVIFLSGLTQVVWNLYRRVMVGFPLMHMFIIGWQRIYLYTYTSTWTWHFFLQRLCLYIVDLAKISTYCKYFLKQTVTCLFHYTTDVKWLARARSWDSGGRPVSCCFDCTQGGPLLPIVIGWNGAPINGREYMCKCMGYFTLPIGAKTLHTS